MPTNTTDTLTGDLLTEEQFARDVVERSERTVKRWRAQRIGPPFIKIGRRIYYRREAVRKWLLSLEQEQPRAGRAAA